MVRKHEVVINQDLCSGCGQCVRDCVAGCLALHRDKAAVVSGGCIACGHCEAVCPRGAVLLTGFEEEPLAFAEQTRLDPGTLMQAMRTRRSIRRFQDRPVSADVVEQIVEAGRLAPTGGNSQRTAFFILGERKAELEALAVQMFRRLVGVGRHVSSFLRRAEIDDNFFFKKAPLIIVLTGSAVDASLAAENMAFMAEAHGLGVLFSGFFTMCVNRNGKLRRAMELKKGEKAVVTLVIGYPAVKYHRTARREPARIKRL